MLLPFLLGFLDGILFRHKYQVVSIKSRETRAKKRDTRYEMQEIRYKKRETRAKIQEARAERQESRVEKNPIFKRVEFQQDLLSNFLLLISWLLFLTSNL